MSPKDGGNAENKALNDSLLNVQDIEYLIPSPSEVISVIRDQGLVYNSKIVSPIQPAKEYTLYRSQALNFGVYLSDLSYFMIFEDQSNAIRYLYHIQELSVILNIEEYFSDEFFNKLLSNLSNPDTLKAISLEQSSLFFSKMQSMGNKDLVLLITTGAMVETLYLSLNVMENKSIDDRITESVISLAMVYDNFYSYMSTSPFQDSNLNKLFTDLQEVRDIFTSMYIKQVSTSIRKENDVVLTSEVNHQINDFLVEKLKISVNRIRENIINQRY
jgi:hypothetical protein